MNFNCKSLDEVLSYFSFGIHSDNILQEAVVAYKNRLAVSTLIR